MRNLKLQLLKMRQLKTLFKKKIDALDIHML